MENIENKNEKVLRKFTYKDNLKNGEVVFECEASDILEADKNMKKK